MTGGGPRARRRGCAGHLGGEKGGGGSGLVLAVTQDEEGRGEERGSRAADGRLSGLDPAAPRHRKE